MMKNFIIKMARGLFYIFLMIILVNTCNAYMQDEKLDLYFSDTEYGLKIRTKLNLPNSNGKIRLIQKTNLGVDGALLQFGGGIEVELEDDLSVAFEAATLNYTPLLDDSVVSKLYFKKDSGVFGIGYVGLPRIYSSSKYGEKYFTLFATKKYTGNHTLNEKISFNYGMDLYSLLLYELPRELSKYEDDVSDESYSRIVTRTSEVEINPVVGLQYDIFSKIKMNIYYGLESSLYQIGRALRYDVKTPMIKYMYIEPRISIIPSLNYRCDISLHYPFNVMLYKDETTYLNAKMIFGSRNKLVLNCLYSIGHDNEQKLMFIVGPDIKGFNISFYANMEFNKEQFSYASLGIRITTSGNELSAYDNPNEYELETKDVYAEKVSSTKDLSSEVLDKIANMTSSNFNEVVQQLQTPDEVRAYTDENFSYIGDSEVIPITPLDVFKNSGGDCDEQSRFQSYVLKQHGYESYVLTYSYNTVGHGICLYRDKETNKWNAIEYGKIYKIDADSIEELISKIKPEYLEYRLNDPDNNYDGLSFIRSNTPRSIQRWFWEKDEVR